MTALAFVSSVEPGGFWWRVCTMPHGTTSFPAKILIRLQRVRIFSARTERRSWLRRSASLERGFRVGRTSVLRRTLVA
jgi:hypothetical protein